MRKRPLCAAALLAVILLWILPSRLFWRESFPDGGPGQIPAVVGEVEQLERTSSGGQAVYLSHSNISSTGLVLVYLKTDAVCSVGNLIQTTGKLKWKEPEEPGNPGQFDARLYYETKGVVLLAYADGAQVREGHVRPLRRALAQVRENLGERCIQLLGERQGGVFCAMALGDKTELSQDLKNLYQRSGMSHLLAISGLHISIFGLGLYQLLRRLGCSYPAAGLPAMGFLLLYGLMTGMSTSTARAVIMFLLAVTADLLGKSYDLLTALACAALLLLLEQPLYARSASFLLSFGAVLGIGAVYPLLLELFPVKKRWLQALLLSLSVQSVTLPLSLFFFYEFSPYGILLNLLVIPLMSLVLFFGTGAVLLSFLSVKAAQLPAIVCLWILRFYQWAGAGSLRLPGAVWIVGKPKSWQLWLYGIGLGMLLLWLSRRRERRGRTRFAFAAVYGALLLVLLVRVPDRGLTFTMLDVGQGDGLFLRTESGTTMLIDGGSSDVSDVGAYRILPFLKEKGVRKLDYVAVTHLDGDHISGVRELLLEAGEPGGIRVGTLLLTEAETGEGREELLALAKSCGARTAELGRGTVLADDSMRMTCLHPEKGEVDPDKNRASMVLQMEYGNLTLLLTGDLDEKGEKEILEFWSGRENASGFVVLKAGHHGSKTSSSEAWLEAVRPDVTLISAGEGNRYGHPNPETLERLYAVGSRVLQTRDCGAITLFSDGKTLRLTVFHQQ